MGPRRLAKEGADVESSAAGEDLEESGAGDLEGLGVDFKEVLVPFRSFSSLRSSSSSTAKESFPLAAAFFFCFLEAVWGVEALNFDH